MNPGSLSLIVSLAWLLFLVVRTNKQMKEDNGELDLRNPIVINQIKQDIKNIKIKI
jgi:hypothetical protein